MRLEPYRRVLAVPGFRSLTLVAFIARIPVTATGVALTLYVVQELGRGYAAAGAVGASATIAAALSGPVLGRLVDRRGLRPALLIGTIGEVVFWSVSPFLPYTGLLIFAGIAGLVRLPVFSVTRQSITAMVGPDQRRQAFALDSMAVELSFMVGPALATVMVTQWSGRATMLTIAAAMAVSGAALFILNPPVRAEKPDPAGSGPVTPGDRADSRAAGGHLRRSWLGATLLIQFVLASAATLTLSGTDIAIIARLREADQLGWAGMVIAVWCGASLVGGFVFGLITRRVSPLVLIGVLCLLTIPVGLADSWMWLCLAVLPTGVFCAPALASSVDAVSGLAPEHSRGEILGWHGAAMTMGTAVGAPLSGAVIDRTGPAFGFAVVGAIGLLIVGLAHLATGGPTGRAAPTRATGPDRRTGPGSPPGANRSAPTGQQATDDSGERILVPLDT